MAAAIFVCVWLLWPPVALAGGLGFAPIAGLASLPLIPGVLKRFKPRPYMAALLAFFVFVGLSALWSPAQFDIGKAGFVKIGLLLAAVGALVSAAGALPPEARDRVVAFAKWALLAQIVIVVLLALFQTQAIQLVYGDRPNDEGVQNISRNSLLMAVAAPPLIVILLGWRKSPISGPLAIAVLVAEAAILLMRDVQAGPLAIVAAGASVGLMRLRPRDGFKILAVLLALLVLSAPFLFGWLSHGADAKLATTSAGWRLAIWAKAVEVIEAHPLFGGGVGVLRTMRDYIGTGVFADQLYMPNHPHNMALQLWAETGAVGAVLFSVAIVMAGWRLPAPRQLGPGGLALGGLIGGATAIAFVSFDFWNEGWWGACGIIATLCAAMARAPAAGPADALRATITARPDHENNFNLLRLLFAVGVAVYHLTLLPGVASLHAFTPITSVAAQIGVQGFFVLSGYLVYASLQRSRSLGIYAEKRVRRLYPAYAVVIIACVIGALVFSEASRGNLASVTNYFLANMAFLNFLKPELRGVFAGNPLTEVNGALWTLKIEVMFYLILPIVGLLIRLAGRYRLALLGAIYVGAEAWRIYFSQVPHDGAVGLFDLEHQLPGQMSFFIVGVGCWLMRDKIIWKWWLVLGAFALLAASFASPWLLPLRALGLGLVSVWVAVGIPRLFDPARFGDLSYGVYIIHFPIIQVVVAMGLFKESPGQGIGISAFAILIAALLLWHLVEKPALRADSAYRRSARGEKPSAGDAQRLGEGEEHVIQG